MSINYILYKTLLLNNHKHGDFAQLSAYNQHILIIQNVYFRSPSQKEEKMAVIT
jgi:hypothetical protein